MLRLLAVAALLHAAACFVPAPLPQLRRRAAAAAPPSPLHRAPQGGRALAPTAPRATGLTQRQGLFGLGVAEIGVILAIGTFVLGPEKLAGFAKDFGKVAGELKEVPKEFSAGLEEGKEAAEATKAIVDAEDAAKAGEPKE